IVLNPRWKQTELLSALAGLECAIRHEQNRTSTPRNAEFLLGLVGQNTPSIGRDRPLKICRFTEIRKQRIHRPKFRHCEERSDEAIQTASAEQFWIASLRSQ
ncbi:MAG TPA: hypothetical protein VGR99_19520, partial [Bradyrhizobium sp.]|nr:hypothetical protein [Bradyrhizobium sp.]